MSLRSQLYRAARILGPCFGRPSRPDKPVVGEQGDRQEAGQGPHALSRRTGAERLLSLAEYGSSRTCAKGASLRASLSRRFNALPIRRLTGTDITTHEPRTMIIGLTADPSMS
jgi:hypothetical protein